MLFGDGLYVALSRYQHGRGIFWVFYQAVDQILDSYLFKGGIRVQRFSSYPFAGYLRGDGCTGQFTLQTGQILDTTSAQFEVGAEKVV